ncbi:ribonuclease H-like domain-containing protein, partial [Delphinella strobiligena]
MHVPLKFQIPPQDLRTALLASTTSGAAFWKHSLYKGPQNEKITIHYCTKFDQAEKQARLFLNESILGFDAEWEPGSKCEVGSIKDNMSLIQIACEHRIALFQVASFHGETAEDLMPPSLKIILESPRIIKAGVNIGADYTRLRRCFGIQGQGLFELSHLFKIVKYSDTDPAKIDKKPCKMA